MSEKPSYEELTKRVQELEQAELQHRQVEEKLRESEEWFRQVVENVREVFWLRDRHDGRILYISPACETIWNRTVEEMYRKGPSFMENVYPEDEERVSVSRRALYEENQPFDEEYRMMRPDQSIRWVRMRCYPVFNQNGEVNRYAFVVENITERKKAEGALQQSKRSFEALAENANDGIIVAGNNGDFLYANRNASEITGYSVDELCKIGTKELAHPNEVPRLIENLKRRLEGEDVPKQYETAIVHKQGKVVPVEITAAKTSWHGYAADLICLAGHCRAEASGRGARKITWSVIPGPEDGVSGKTRRRGGA